MTICPTWLSVLAAWLSRVGAPYGRNWPRIGGAWASGQIARSSGEPDSAVTPAAASSSVQTVNSDPPRSQTLLASTDRASYQA